VGSLVAVVRLIYIPNTLIVSENATATVQQYCEARVAVPIRDIGTERAIATKASKAAAEARNREAMDRKKATP
jgi:hypothetical protein